MAQEWGIIIIDFQQEGYSRCHGWLPFPRQQETVSLKTSEEKSLHFFQTTVATNYNFY